MYIRQNVSWYDVVPYPTTIQETIFTVDENAKLVGRMKSFPFSHKHRITRHAIRKRWDRKQAAPGGLFTDREREYTLRSLGRCYSCCRRTHTIGEVVEPLANERVYQGCCISCNPQHFPKAFLQIFLQIAIEAQKEWQEQSIYLISWQEHVPSEKKTEKRLRHISWCKWVDLFSWQSVNTSLAFRPSNLVDKKWCRRSFRSTTGRKDVTHRFYV